MLCLTNPVGLIKPIKESNQISLGAWKLKKKHSQDKSGKTQSKKLGKTSHVVFELQFLFVIISCVSWRMFSFSEENAPNKNQIQLCKN